MIRFDVAWYTVLIAFFLDWKYGDPAVPWHPVSLMGRVIEKSEIFFRDLIAAEFRAGLVFALVLAVGAWAGATLLLSLAAAVAAPLAVLVSIALLYFVISARSLEQAALAVYYHLAGGDTAAARKSLALIVGREVERLDEPGVCRATVETVAENLVDGLIAPLFFVLIGGVPLAVAYRMINTMDAMVGYKNERYRFFGRAAARLDDAANYIPARLSLFFISLAAALLRLRGFRSLIVGLKEGRQHSSPNAGYPEAAFAGALSLQLGGPSYYHGRLVEKPFIGLGLGRAEAGDILSACRLMLLSSILACVAAVILILVL